jgi:hypothetical protein
MKAIISGEWTQEWFERAKAQFFNNVMEDIRQTLIERFRREQLTDDAVWEYYENVYEHQINSRIENLYLTRENEIRRELIRRGYAEEAIDHDLLWQTFTNERRALIEFEKRSLFNGLEPQIRDEMETAWIDANLTYNLLRETFETEYKDAIDQLYVNGPGGGSGTPQPPFGVTYGQEFGFPYPEWWDIADSRDALDGYDGLVYRLEVGDEVVTNTMLGYNEIRMNNGSFAVEFAWTEEGPVRYIFATNGSYLS